MATRVLVVEDEFIIAEDISETLRSLGYLVTGTAMGYNEALKLLDTQKPDIVLVDINLGEEKDGIDVGIAIREKYQLPFIFITSHADKTTVDRAKHLKPNGYLVKPFDKNDLYTGIEIALANFSKKPEEQPLENDASESKDALFIKDGTTFIKIKHEDIWYLKSEANYVSIHTAQKNHLIRKTLKEMGLILPQTLFFQIHKSFIINTSYIDSVSGGVVLIKKEEIPIGREYKELFFKKIKIT